MQEAIVFGGQNSLDFCEVRESIIRIPEVSLRIEEAQELWDKNCGTSFSFQHFLTSENTYFFNNINLKSLSLAVVQLGLLDRYNRLFRNPEILVGNTQNDSALMVAAGLMTFSEMIEKSQSCHMLRPMTPLHDATDLLLKGRSLPQFQAFQVAASGPAQPMCASSMGLEKILQQLIEERKIKRIVHIGPGPLSVGQLNEGIQSHDVQVVESIDVDPMLGWFWAELRKQNLSLDHAQ